MLIDAVVKKDVDRQRRVLSTAQMILLAICGVILTTWTALHVFGVIHWSALLNLSGAITVEEVNSALYWSGVIVVVNVLTSYVQAVYAAHQRLHVYTLWYIAGQVSAFAALYISVYCRAGLSVLVLCFYGIPALVMVTNAVWIAAKYRETCMPGLRLLSRAQLRQLLKFGASFELIAVTGALQYSTDNIIISGTLGSDSVADFAIVVKLYNVFLTLIGIVLMPMWAGIANAKSSGDADWIRRQLRGLRTVVIATYAVFYVAVLVGGRMTIRIWAGPSIVPSQAVIAILGLYYGARAWADVHSIVCNALDRAPMVAVLGVGVGVVSVAAMYFSASIAGTVGLATGMALSMLLLSAIPLTVIAVRSLGRIEYGLEQSQYRHHHLQ
jgi:O-antigen/teichoic acid export membrane protein